MGLSLRGQTSGAVDINAPDVAGDNTITLPGGNGSANQFYKNSDTAGIITHSSMTESSSGVISIGDIDINGTTRTITTGVGQTVGFSTDIKIQGSVRIEDPSVSATRLSITYEGIDFQNTGAGSSSTAASHLLDDYEEGTWTPTYVPGSGSFTSITYDPLTFGRYTKVGRLCHAWGFIRTDAITLGTAAGNVQMGGFPFGANVGNGMANVGSITNISGWAGEQPIAMRMNTTNNTEAIFFYRTSVDGGDGASNVNDLSTGVDDNRVYFTITYEVA